MKFVRAALFLLLIGVPLLSNAAVKFGDFPGTTVWYLHADLAQMRSSESGSPLYHWLNGQVFVDLHDELGIDINKEADWLTAFSNPDGGTVIILAGPMSKDSQDKILALLSSDNKLDVREYKDRTYYQIGDEEAATVQHDDPLDSIEDNAFFTFAVKGKLLVASQEDQLKALIDNGGKVSGSGSHEGALFVLTADKAFVQAGLKTEQISDDDDDDWDSKIIRNTEQVAVMVSDLDGMIAVEAQLVARDALITRSIGGIVNGLISLQVFNSELDPGLRAIIENTRIDVDDKVLSVSTVIDPQVVVAILDD